MGKSFFFCVEASMAKRVLFICSGNSAGSQMAEGLLKSLGKDGFEVFSAGTHPIPVRPKAIQVMKEIGIDISRHYSKTLDRFVDQEFDFVVTVCDSAKENCPVFYGAKETLHWSIEDPWGVGNRRDDAPGFSESEGHNCRKDSEDVRPVKAISSM